MQLLRVCRVESGFAPDGVVRFHTAWLALAELPVDHQALVSTNVQVLRRVAPYACLLVSGTALDEWKLETLGTDPVYLARLRQDDIRRGAPLIFPAQEAFGSLRVVELGCLDVLPFTTQLAGGEVSLYCTPDPCSATAIGRVFENAPDAWGALSGLLAGGGCLLSIVDEVRLSIWTSNPAYARYFTGNSSTLAAL